MDKDSVTVSTIETARETGTSRTSRMQVIGAIIDIKLWLPGWVRATHFS